MRAHQSSKSHECENISVRKLVEMAAAAVWMIAEICFHFKIQPDVHHLMCFGQEVWEIQLTKSEMYSRDYERNSVENLVSKYLTSLGRWEMLTHLMFCSLKGRRWQRWQGFNPNSASVCWPSMWWSWNLIGWIKYTSFDHRHRFSWSLSFESYPARAMEARSCYW